MAVCQISKPGSEFGKKVKKESWKRKTRYYEIDDLECEK